MSSSQLVSFCSEDDRLAIERLGRDFRASLLRYFGRRVRERADLEDMVQEVFERLIKRGGTSELERQNLNAYVFETASSVLVDRIRKRTTHRTDAHEPFDLNRHENTDFSPEHVLLSRERLSQALAVILELPERTQAIFVLRRIEGMRVNEIAKRLEISNSSVEKHMQRAVVHLMQRIDFE